MRTDVAAFVEGLDSALRAGGTAERAEHEARYLKSELTHYGTSVPDTRAAVKSALSEAGELTHEELMAVVEALWAAPVHERRQAAIEVLVARVRLLGIADLRTIERIAREARTWALIDPLSTGVVGPLIEGDPAWGEVLDRFATDDDFWVRRTALLALLVPLRRGEGDWERFARYADAMLDDTEFFIRKAIGWVLRDTAKRRPDLVFEWLLPRAGRASAVTLREALKPLSPAQRATIESACN